MILETHIPGLLSLLAGALLRETLRESDIVAYDPAEDRFVILLAQTDGPRAEQAVTRLDRIVRRRIRVQTRAGVARFPEHGLTLDDLLRSAEGAWRSTPFDAYRDSSPSENGKVAPAAPESRESATHESASREA